LNMHLYPSNKMKFYSLGLLLSLLLAAVVLIFTASSAAAAGMCVSVADDSAPVDPEPAANQNAVAPNCRYGVSASQQGATDIEEMKIGWLVSFIASEPSWLPANVAHTPMVRLKQDRDPTTNSRLPTYTARPAFTENGLGRLVRANPGAVWIIGNEVDRFQWQDDILPDLYATAYHDAYHFIKQIDPTAQIAVSALVLISPGRLQYLDRALAAYKQKYGTQMPVDVWTFHAYIFPERKEPYNGQGLEGIYASIAVGTDPDLAIMAPSPQRPLAEQIELCKRDDYICVHQHDNMELFRKQVVDMRTWMKVNGYQNKPLLLTEWSLLHTYVQLGGGDCGIKDEFGNCFVPGRVTNFLEASVEYLESAIATDLGYPLDNYRLVQQWAWFALDNLGDNQFTEGNPSLMIDPSSGNLTQMGRKYRDLIQETTTQPNLVIDTTYTDLVNVAPSTSGTAQLKVSIRNNGNSKTTVPFDVIFYSDSGHTQEIGRATIPAGIDGCAVVPAFAEVEWQNLNEGVHRYWVVADKDGVASPGDLSNRSGSSVVLVNPVTTFLPLMER
jgi:hypothetical protein